jgi:hypothetical protein
MAHHFSFEYVKKNPLMFGMIVLVFGVFVYLYLNRGAVASTSTVVTQSGPSDAQLAADAQIQIAQIGAGAQTQQLQAQLNATQLNDQAQISLAQISATSTDAQTAAETKTALANTDASLKALLAQTGAQVAMNQSNNNATVAYATIVNDSALAQVQMNDNLTATMSAQQLEAYKVGAFTSALGTVKKKDRDNILETVSGSIYGSGSSSLFGSAAPVQLTGASLH